MNDNVVCFTGMTKNRINSIRMMEAIVNDISEQDDVIVIVVPSDKNKKATYHMSNPNLEKTIFQLEYLKHALIRDCFYE